MARAKAGVLVAISIPIFTSQLEKAREATDAANLRSAYAEVMVDALDNDTAEPTRTVKLTQTTDGWGYVGKGTDDSIGGVKFAEITATPGGTVTVKFNRSGEKAGKVSFTTSKG